MNVLVYVRNNGFRPEYFYDERRAPVTVVPVGSSFEGRDYTTEDMSRHRLFEVHEENLNEFISWVTRQNPGCEVEVYHLKQSAIRPAGELVTRNVTENGVLPG